MADNPPATSNTPIPAAPIAPLASAYTPTPAPVSALPEAVQAIRRIEQKNGLPPVPKAGSPTPPPPTDKSKTHLFNFIPWTGRIGLMFKILFAGVASVVAFLLIMFLLMISSIDTTIIKLTLSGSVIGNDDQPVVGATIKVAELQTTSGAGGNFSLGGLDIGTYKVQIEANGYETFEQEVAITRGFLNYNTTRQFTIRKSGIATLSGKLIPPVAGYSFVNDRIMIGSQDYRINDDGSYKIVDLVTGKTKFEFKSINFRDEVRDFQLEAGDKSLPDITLSPAGDIVASVKSWIREDLVLNLKVTVEGVNEEYIQIAADGTLRVRDLEVAKEYKLRTEYPGYETRDYTATIAQGDNQLFDFRVVEKGFVPFLRKVDQNLQIFIANFDGVNEKQLTSFDTQPYAEYIEGNNVFFFSSRDNIFSSQGKAAMLAYAAPIAGGNPQRITTPTDGLSRTIPNLKASRFLNIAEGATPKSRILELYNLQGTKLRTLESIPEGQFVTAKVSDDATTVWYTMQNNQATINGLYRTTADNTTGKGELVLNKSNLQFFGVSASGDRALYSAKNANTGLQDLYVYIYSTRQDTLVKTAYPGFQYTFVTGSETKLLFIENRDGVANLFVLDVSTNTDSKLTTFSGTTEGVEAVSQQSGYTLYQTNKGLYIIDINQPHSAKLVTTNVKRYTGYDF